MPERLTFTVPELAKYLGIGIATAYKHLKSGEIPSIRLQKRRLIPRAAIDQWLQNAGNKERAPHA